MGNVIVKRSAGGLLAALVTAAAITGCSPGQPAGPKAYNYSSDGYLGTTSANPNLALNPGYHTYQVDSDIALSVLGRLKGVVDTQLQFKGPIGYVKLSVPRGTPPEKAAAIRAQAEQDLHTQLPRYRFIVTVKR
ncbi:hypothetical protein PC41400_29385 [Paenibacillus chitinolyticus]|uniref:Sporulation protein n=1 Tax=Paenibacillus chitinolyticus TaxID=79263 RepID=A0A410X4M0_9BACL|nr:hypothetical protein [Paenibacillus chitinolyticus]MCY9593368.1 hypothetical protein [Paenibacillus chitinolyticus]MCY9597116.1 hypothetical protein [Paenibacillus chitinolyticus]QAV21546.1 hypothetical protein PC41400_29385 [Paenibacillus chitinolyticus]